MDIEKAVIKTMTECFGEQVGEVTIDSTNETLNLDSLDEIEAIVFMEEKFDIEIPDKDRPKLTSVRNMVDYITEAVAE